MKLSSLFGSVKKVVQFVVDVSREAVQKMPVIRSSGSWSGFAEQRQQSADAMAPETAQMHEPATTSESPVSETVLSITAERAGNKPSTPPSTVDQAVQPSLKALTPATVRSFIDTKVSNAPKGKEAADRLAACFAVLTRLHDERSRGQQDDDSYHANRGEIRFHMKEAYIHLDTSLDDVAAYAKADSAMADIETKRKFGKTEELSNGTSGPPNYTPGKIMHMMSTAHSRKGLEIGQANSIYNNLWKYRINYTLSEHETCLAELRKAVAKHAFLRTSETPPERVHSPERTDDPVLARARADEWYRLCEVARLSQGGSALSRVTTPVRRAGVSVGDKASSDPFARKPYVGKAKPPKHMRRVALKQARSAAEEAKRVVVQAAEQQARQNGVEKKEDIRRRLAERPNEFPIDFLSMYFSYDELERMGEQGRLSHEQLDRLTAPASEPAAQ